ncbi:hypothetical protein J2Y03_003307 [Neobacillus niacini]|uniref:hypothetical protein n=1 Tax=Neobacillus niacini TaxID=86668 RepID=UPI0028638AA6|nr:hypothetical protein [Neobacillus niacini]MDR7078257.1 hypothetical protein [Neobacillus niacini]
MRKILPLLFTSLLVFLIFVGQGNSVQAADDCECDITILTGSEKNKIVSGLLKSDELKNARKEIRNMGHKWHGVNDIEVIRNNTWNGVIIISIPVFTLDGTEMTAGFISGKFIGVFPSDSHGE